jgi:hypothetical protein
MNWGWLIGAVVVWLVSAICIIGTIAEVGTGKNSIRKPGFWGGVAFHAVTAVAALWLLLKAMGKA